jgi:D-alanyl-D-alanine carboxypeptidase (penicillin-binding protein 5/6)
MQKRTARDRHEDVFCLCMVLFIIFEIILLTALLIGALTPPAVAGPPKDDETTATDTDESTDAVDPADQKIFSGGVVPTRPDLGASTPSIAGIGSRYALLLNATSGEVIAATDANTRFQPASLTKVMTLIVACEYFKTSDLARKLTLTEAVWSYVRSGAYQGASVAGHDPLDELTVRDLLYGIGMESAADCTVMIAEEIAGSEADFVELMNRKAEELGLRDTHFDNAIGHESADNYTTATEMAMIMAYAMQCDLIEDILAKTQHVFQVWYYDDAGEYKSFRFTYYSTLFRGRMETYENNAGKEFSLSTVTLRAGKTGSFITSASIACTARAKSGGGEYILILGEVEKTETQSAAYRTMCDVKTVFDTYVK